mgnify:CR=1 FL=1
MVCGASGGSLDFTLRAECEMGGEEVRAGPRELAEWMGSVADGRHAAEGHRAAWPQLVMWVWQVTSTRGWSHPHTPPEGMNSCTTHAHTYAGQRLHYSRAAPAAVLAAAVVSARAGPHMRACDELLRPGVHPDLTSYTRHTAAPVPYHAVGVRR